MTAEIGETRIQRIRAHHPGIVFTDLKMAGMHGFEVLNQQKRNTPATEAIVITGHGDMDQVVRALPPDATGFIDRPIGRGARDAALKRAKARLEPIDGVVFLLRWTLRGLLCALKRWKRPSTKSQSHDHYFVHQSKN